MRKLAAEHCNVSRVRDVNLLRVIVLRDSDSSEGASVTSTNSSLKAVDINYMMNRK